MLRNITLNRCLQKVSHLSPNVVPIAVPEAPNLVTYISSLSHHLNHHFSVFKWKNFHVIPSFLKYLTFNIYSQFRISAIPFYPCSLWQFTLHTDRWNSTYNWTLKNTGEWRNARSMTAEDADKTDFHSRVCRIIFTRNKFVNFIGDQTFNLCGGEMMVTIRLVYSERLKLRNRGKL